MVLFFTRVRSVLEEESTAVSRARRSIRGRPRGLLWDDARSDAVPMSDEKVCVGIGMGEMATGYSFSRECLCGVGMVFVRAVGGA